MKRQSGKSQRREEKRREAKRSEAKRREGKGREEKRREEERRKKKEERRSEERKSQKTEDAGARKGSKVAKHCVSQMICGSGGARSRRAKAAGAEDVSQNSFVFKLADRQRR